jgi:hypothetical protein
MRSQRNEPMIWEINVKEIASICKSIENPVGPGPSIILTTLSIWNII